LEHLLAWVSRQQPDLLAIQETKLTDDAFPHVALAASGYRAVASGQKTYNGVAILSREPAEDIDTELPGRDDPQRRLLAATVAGVRIVNVYVPNGQEVGSDKYEYKLAWLDGCRDYLAAQLARHPRLVVLGDFNIAPEDRDVYDPAAWAGQVLCSEPERLAFQGLLDLGLSDAFRAFDQPEATWTWWDYRMAAYRRNLGLRIDHLLVSAALRQTCIGCCVDREPRGWERPSDHAPVVADFAG
jgi:exodeoxyribonuclease-3